MADEKAQEEVAVDETNENETNEVKASEAWNRFVAEMFAPHVPSASLQHVHTVQAESPAEVHSCILGNKVTLDDTLCGYA